MASSLLILSGAPEQDTLDWDEDALGSTLDSPVKRFLASSYQSRTTAALSSLPPSKWRSVLLSRSVAHTNHDESGKQPQTQLLSFHGINDDSQERTRFLEHSLTFLNELESSQIVLSQPTGYDEQTTFPTDLSLISSDGATSMGSVDDSFAAGTVTPGPAQGIPPSHLPNVITDLKRIPPASHLERIQPQTMTVNLIAAVIKVQPIRTVRLRRRNTEMDILDVLVGDETRAGFSISFWLHPVKVASRAVVESRELRETLARLRAGEVVSVQNVALSAWKGQVYGQSLSRRFARNSTGLFPLREDGMANGVAKAKFKRVQDWSEDFIGAPVSRPVARGSKQRREPAEEHLPPDTQSSMA